MKGPLITAVAVLVAGGLLVIRQHSQIQSLREGLDAVHTEAESIGVPVSMRVSASRRGNVTEDRKAATLVNEVTDLLDRAQAIERAGGKPDNELKNQIVDVTVRLMELSPANMRRVLAGMRDDESISEETKSKVIGMSILFVSEDHPEEAVQLFEESKHLLGKGTMAVHVVSSALESWAKVNPAAAAEWLKSNKEPPPGVTRDEMVHAVLGGAAENSPDTAFRMISTLEIDNHEDACEIIASTLAGSQQGRENLLTAMRNHLATLEDKEKADAVANTVMESMARELGKNSFDEVSRWLDANQLSEGELASFAGGLSWFTTGKETGAWLEWMAGRLTEDQLAEPVEGLVSDWVEEDYIAAGQWLTQTPDGPMKNPSVKAYAEAVAAYDPEVATQWAMTIKDPEARMQTLRAIHSNWPADDEAGATRFAAQHGLDH